jgi:hypothetical protein
MPESNSDTGNVTPNAVVQMAISYSRSCTLCAAARLGIADALGDEARSVDNLAETCQADVEALYRLLRALASIGITEETTPKHFRLTPFEGRCGATWPSRHGQPSQARVRRRNHTHKPRCCRKRNANVGGDF